MLVGGQIVRDRWNANEIKAWNALAAAQTNGLKPAALEKSIRAVAYLKRDETRGIHTKTSFISP